MEPGVCLRIQIFTVLIVRSASWLKLKSSSFSEMLRRGLLSVCQAYAELHGNIFNYSKTVCMTFKAMSAKSTITPWLTRHVDGKNLLTNTNIWELYWILNSQMTKTFRDNCDKNIVQQTSCEPLLPMFKCSQKCTFSFLLYAHACITVMVEFQSHACKDCVWPIILVAELYTTCPGELVLVVMTHQVQCNIPTFEAVIRKNMHLFLERCRSTNVMAACFDAVRLFIFVLILWILQPHFLCNWVLGLCSVCSFEGVHVTMHSYFTWAWPGINVPLCSGAVPSEQIVLIIRL